MKCESQRSQIPVVLVQVTAKQKGPNAVTWVLPGNTACVTAKRLRAADMLQAGGGMGAEFQVAPSPPPAVLTFPV